MQFYSFFFILALLGLFLIIYTSKDDISRDFALCTVILTILLWVFCYSFQQYTEKVTAETIQAIHEKAETSNKKRKTQQTIEKSKRNIYNGDQSESYSNLLYPSTPNSPMSPLNPISPIYIFD